MPSRMLGRKLELGVDFIVQILVQCCDSVLLAGDIAFNKTESAPGVSEFFFPSIASFRVNFIKQITYLSGIC